MSNNQQRINNESTTTEPPPYNGQQPNPLEAFKNAFKVQSPVSLTQWFRRRRVFKSLKRIWAWQLFLSCDQDFIVNFTMSHLMDAPFEILSSIDFVATEKICLNILMAVPYERP